MAAAPAAVAAVPRKNERLDMLLGRMDMGDALRLGGFSGLGEAAGELVCAGGLARAARVAGEDARDLIDGVTGHELGDGLEVAIAAAGKLDAQHLAAVIGKIEVDIARAYTLRLVVKTNH